METRFNIGDRVSYFNDSVGQIESSTVKGIRAVPREISKDEKGRDVFGEAVVFYHLSDDAVLSERSAFADAEECRRHYLVLFSSAESARI